jgi:SAM-dependent methyltransferase
MENPDQQVLHQEAEYEFPYHHLADLANLSNHRSWPWAIHYAVYLRTVIRLVVEERPTSVLDVGCGDGKLIWELARVLPPTTRMMGVDVSERAIHFARGFNFGNGAEFRCSDVAELDETFDVVTLIETLEHIPDALVSRVTTSISARIKPGGKLIVTVPSIAVPLLQKHYRHYTREVLIESFPSLEPVYCSQFIHWTPLLERLQIWATAFASVGRIRRPLWRLIEQRAAPPDPNGPHVLGVFQRRLKDTGLIRSRHSDAVSCSRDLRHVQ